MIETLMRDLRQPEYLHTLLNPIPIYGLAFSVIGLIIALFSRSRAAQIIMLVLVLVCAVSAGPVSEFGEGGYDPVLSMSDDAGRAWLDAHRHRAEEFIYFFYALAALAAVAVAAPLKWPKSSRPLVAAVILLGLVVVGMGGYIGYAGGKIRHREFRNTPPPPPSERTHS